MSDILCVYYSRTGRTRRIMEEIGEALDAEVICIQDSVQRNGWVGWLRCGLDAMRSDTAPVEGFEPRMPLESYRLVIIGTPVWAGRCSSVVRSFLKTYGNSLRRTAYVVTRGSEDRFEEIYDQMDRYTAKPHKLAVSLRAGDVGCHFWQEDFLRQVKAYLAGK